MAIFVIETYLSRARSPALEEMAARLRGAIGSTGARYLRSFYVTEDEIAYHFVEIGTLEAAAELSRAAGLAPERIVEAEAASA